MRCLKCEVLRATFYAHSRQIVGRTREQIAESLSSIYGAKYYVDKGVIWRENNPSPIRIY